MAWPPPLLLLSALSASLTILSVYCQNIYTIHVTEVPMSSRLATSVLTGLINRKLGAPSILALINRNDPLWEEQLLQQDSLYANATYRNLTGLPELFEMALEQGAVQGQILYSYTEKWSLPNVISLAGIYQAIPVPDVPTSMSGDWQLNSTSLSTLPVMFSAGGKWENAVNATEWALSNIYSQCNSTDTLVVLQDPGKLEQGFLADLAVFYQLFLFWLPDMCTANSSSAALYNQITESAHAQGSLLSLIGYFPDQEVVAECSRHHTEVSLVADFCSSLSFWSLMPPVQQPLQQAPPLQLPSNLDAANNVFLAIIVSDGDNMQMDFNRMRRMEQRVQLCAQPGSVCPPLSWTMSNRLADFAPFILQWYYRQAVKTGRDSFLLGPSGYGYLHPSIIDPADPLLDRFVQQTMSAAKSMSASAYVHWDDPTSPFSGTAGTVHASNGNWSQNLEMRQYIGGFGDSSIDAVFTPNGPSGYVEGVATFQEVYRWGSGDPMTSVRQALSSLRDGTMGYVYVLPDVAMSEMDTLAQALPGHVRFVGYRELSAMQHAMRAQGMQAAGTSSGATHLVIAIPVSVLALTFIVAGLLLYAWRRRRQEVTESMSTVLALRDAMDRPSTNQAP